ncbi:MAG: T9SS type A sorting domain-containing protein, partial [Saprospiraceae bacterium]
NPFSTHIQVTLNASFPGSVLKMYNQLGDLVLDQKLSLGSNTFLVEGMPTGLYYWVFRAHGEVIKTGKLVKVK